MNQGIYKIINIINNKFYVGSAVDFKRRRANHFRHLRNGNHHNKHLQAAWDKYGEAAFIWVVVETVANRDELLDRENEWLKSHVGKDYCYNIAMDATAPGLGKIGELNPMWGKTFSHTDEAIEKIRLSSLGRPVSEASRAKRRNFMLGNIVVGETKHKISETLKRAYTNGYAHPRLGKKHSEETREKIVAARAASDKNKGEKHYRYGKTVSEETRKKIGDTQRGVEKGPRVYTEEGLAKARENMKRNAKEQKPAPFTEVLAKFPQEVQDRYDFTNAIYTGALNRITGCICHKHGEFSQIAAQFRKGSGCPGCGAEQRAATIANRVRKTKYAESAYLTNSSQ